MRLLVMPKTKHYSSYITNGASGFLLGLRDFSTGFFLTHSLEEIRQIKEQFPNQDIFVSINKMIYDEEIKTLQENLLNLQEIGITGVLFYDMAILNLYQKLHLLFHLVWNETHMVTNSRSLKFYQQQGVDMAFLSGEITLDEMLAIKDKTNMPLMVLLSGYPPVSFSKRKLINNYYQFLGERPNNELVIKEPISKQEYLLLENKDGTQFFYKTILNGSKPYLELLRHNFDYGVLQEVLDHERFLKVLSLFKEMQDKKGTDKALKDDQFITKVTEELGSNDTLFFYKKTIFKVKKNEKS